MNHQVIRSRFLFSAAILGLVGTALGCGAQSVDEAALSYNEDTLTEANDAGHISLATDRVLALKLDGHLSVGRGWQIESIDTNVLRVADKDIEGSGDLGGIDKQIMRFVGVSKGTTVLKLKYGRPWENKTEKTYSVQVDVAGPYNGNFRPAPVVVSAPIDDGGPRVGLPTHYSICEQGGCTPVKDQGGCGSCWAFATVGVVESTIAMHDKVTRDISEQYLVSCNNENMGCDGGWLAFSYFIDRIPSGEPSAGAVYESDFPYSGTDEACGSPHPHHEKIKSLEQVSSTSVNAIKQAMLDHGAIWTSVCADDAFMNYQSGVFHGTKCGAVNHAVVLVGWDDNGGDGYWILRNSWSSGWGEKGYMRIKYGANMINGTPYYVTYGNDNGGDSCPVKLFADPSYRGASTCLDVGRFDISKLRSTIGNDTLSSVRVKSGYKVTLFQDSGFRGSTKVLTGDASSLPTFNDKASSVTVERQ